METAVISAPKNGMTPLSEIPKGKKIKYKINHRPSQNKKKSAHSKAQIQRREHEKSSVRAKVERVFGVVKGQLGYRINTIPRSAETDGKTEYAVCSGKSHSG